MPLEHSSSKEALKRNMEMLHGEIGKSPHVKSRAQAVAIALNTAREASRKGRAAGGAAPPWYVRNEARGMLHTGPIHSPVAGRTDHIPLSVPNGSYVLPASHVSHIGQNNTAAGFARLNHMFTSGPFGVALPHMGRSHLPSAPRAPSPKLAAGGVSDGRDHDGVDIMAAGGEYVIPPEIVRAIGDGNIDHGHAYLDAWVKHVQEKHAKTIKNLPGPAKD